MDEGNIRKYEEALVSWVQTFQKVKFTGNSLRELKDGRILFEILLELDPTLNESQGKNQTIIFIYNYLQEFYKEAFHQMITDIVEINVTELRMEGDSFKPHLINLISLIIGICVRHQNTAEYINAIQDLSEEKRDLIVELLETVLKQKEKTTMLERIEEFDFDKEEEIKESDFNVEKERKMREKMDELQAERDSLKNDLVKKEEEITDLKKKNQDFMIHMKNLVMTHDSRIIDRSYNYEEMETQIKIKDSKILDLQERLDQQIKSYGKEISNLKIELQGEKCKTLTIPKLEKTLDAYKSKLKKQEDVKLLKDEIEILKSEKAESDAYHQATISKMSETIKNNNNKIVELEKSNNDLVIKWKEMEEKTKQYESLMNFQNEKLKEQASEQKSQIKSQYFSAQGSFISNNSKSPLKISTLKNQLPHEDSNTFEFHNVEFLKNSIEIQTDPIKFEENDENDRKYKMEVEKLKTEIEKLKIESNKLKNDEVKMKADGVELKEYIKKLSEELNILKMEKFELETQVNENQMMIEELNETKEELNQLRLIIDDNTKKNRELQLKIGKLEMECRVTKKTARDEEREKISSEIAQIKKKFEYKTTTYQQNLESKEQEIKLLLSVLCDLRLQYEETMEHVKEQQLKTKGGESFLNSLSNSQKK